MTQSSLKNIYESITINPIVKEAMASNAPVVALESTIITHGLPYPQNVETALAVEEVVRREGAIPASIAVLSGKICIGLHNSEIEKIGKPTLHDPVLKLSRRDLAYALAMKRSGGTTVAATLLCSHLVGIPIFATGGIGGVHRNGENSLDISADLQELSKNNVSVVCAGAKSILDIGLTLEVLESLSVSVIGYKTDYFPAFYSSKSPFKVDYRVDNLNELATLMSFKMKLENTGGILIANPIPHEDELPFDTVEAHIQGALAEASDLNIKGKEVTPFLLSQIVRRTEGRCISANISLIKNNAKIAAQLAVAYAGMKGGGSNLNLGARLNRSKIKV